MFTSSLKRPGVLASAFAAIFLALVIGSSLGSAKATAAPKAGPKLNLKISGLAKTVPADRARKFKLRVANRGSGPARRVQVVLNGTQGLKLSPRVRAFSLLRPRQAITVNVTVRANRRAAGRGRIGATATARRAGMARAVRAVQITRPGSGVGQKPSSGRITSPVGHYFWAIEKLQVMRSSDAIGFYFANERFVHIGIPEGGLPPCNRASIKRDSDGQIESGCARYTYNPRNGAIVIAGQLRGRFTAKGGRSSVEFDDTTYYLATIPKRGSTLRVHLTHRGYRGFCGLITGCTTWTENLGLDRRGRFVRSRSNITSAGGAGVPFIWAASFPPDEHGTYRILGDGRIQFRYKDGTISNETIAIQHDAQGRPDAAREGVVLDHTWFYFEED